jgi:hypothetical protein
VVLETNATGNFIENANTGIKSFNILVYAFCNHKAKIEDDVIAKSASFFLSSGPKQWGKLL